MHINISSSGSNSGERRRFLSGVAAAAGLAFVACTKTASRGAAAAGPAENEAEVTPGEDLMQEHGVLERILLIYDESIRRLQQGELLNRTVVASAAGIVRRFVEEYHEKLEEQYVFPQLEAAKREVELVAILREQHKRGRDLTDAIVRTTEAPSATPELLQSLQAFVRMYRPHAAREDTVLFPAFRSVVGGKAYRELGDRFEAEEHKLFGSGGFENTVAQVAQLESALGIYDLARFTPS